MFDVVSAVDGPATLWEAQRTLETAIPSGSADSGAAASKSRKRTKPSKSEANISDEDEVGTAQPKAAKRKQ